jgi:CRP/FNR family cyclic AMP-dependent transcriptional regulator
METLELIIGEHPFFKELEKHHLKLIVGCASNIRFNAGEFIFREGEVTGQFYLIRHGKVALEILAPERGPIRIQTLGKGEILGWSWLVAPYRKYFDARAIELTRAIAFDGTCLRGKFDEDPKLGYELLRRFASVMAERLQATRIQLLDLYGNRSWKGSAGARAD